MSIFSEIWSKIDFFAKEVPNIGISPGFLLIKKGSGVSNMFCKFWGPYHADIFQNGDLKYFQVATTPLYSDFDGLPYPPC